MTGNSIPVLQNEPDVVELLAAAHGLYGRARVWVRGQYWSAAILPALFAVAALRSRQWLELGAMYAVVMLLADEMIEKMIDRYRRSAATAQQMFDCTLYGWPLRCGLRPLDASDVQEWARKGSVKGLPLNWYPDNIAAAPPSLARVICQRANLWWDAKLRSGYVVLMFACAAVLVFIAAAAAWRFDWTIGATALATVNVLPVVQWCVRNGIRHLSTQNSTHEQSERALSIQQGLIARLLTDAVAEEESRCLQEDIYERRRTAPLGVPWIYRRSRAEFDRGMKANAAKVVSDYRSASTTSIAL